MDYEELTEEQIKYTNYEEELTSYMLEEQQKQIEEIKKEQDKSKDYLFLYLLELIKDYVDVFIPDLKYFSPDASERYSGARDYFDVASEALRRMFELAGPLVEKDGILQRGMIVRHLVLPGLRKDSMKLIDWLWSEFGDDIYLSLMNQYTPMHRSADYPEINRRLTTFEYDSVVNYAYDAGFRKSFIQDRRAASEEYVPDWTGDGVENY